MLAFSACRSRDLGKCKAQCDSIKSKGVLVDAFAIRRNLFRAVRQLLGS
jgi:hypothetical protein